MDINKLKEMELSDIDLEFGLIEENEQTQKNTKLIEEIREYYEHNDVVYLKAERRRYLMYKQVSACSRSNIKI